MRGERGLSGLVTLSVALALAGCGGGGGDDGGGNSRPQTPPVISAQTPPPTAVNYGDTASFKVTATDADGDAIPGFEVAYGPAGFSVTAQGDVSWTPSGP